MDWLQNTFTKHCNVCSEILGSTENITVATDLLESFKCLLINVNCKLLQDTQICQTCLPKIQAAHRLKACYSEISQQTLVIKKEDGDPSGHISCEICKKVISSSESIPFFYSVVDKLTLIKYFPLESKASENPQTCDECHKSLLNYCIIINLLCIFEDNTTDCMNEKIDIESKLFQQLGHAESTSFTNNFEPIIKKENDKDYMSQDETIRKHTVPGSERGLECSSQGVKTEEDSDLTYRQFQLIKEEIDLKSEDEDQDDESASQYNQQEIWEGTFLSQGQFACGRSELNPNGSLTTTTKAVRKLKLNVDKKKKGGIGCSARNCFNKQYNCRRKFFRFPKQPERARIWILKAEREDLLEKIDCINKSYRLCDEHFEEKMYTNHLHERLSANAIPTLF